ncbi:hypothetical protein Aca07nite_42120 [Actinoplanes capillaceus]|uniref:Uncharacterized protein n=2 Tax=Actinoplanes campanulatus TaxID=113559 RepID=A0ABQ3WL40_9ACTN|nr:hypothetical protein Aca07nite_42120 [Actinoplanes capillaceus]
MDYPLSEQWRVADLLDTLDGYDVTLVEVHCTPEELDRREHARGDRPIGLARSQTMVYTIADADFVVDTTNTSAGQGATVITIWLNHVHESSSRTLGCMNPGEQMVNDCGCAIRHERGLTRASDASSRAELWWPRRPPGR